MQQMTKNMMARILKNLRKVEEENNFMKIEMCKLEEENKALKSEIRKLKAARKWLMLVVVCICIMVIAVLLPSGNERNVNLKMLH